MKTKLGLGWFISNTTTILFLITSGLPSDYVGLTTENYKNIAIIKTIKKDHIIALLDTQLVTQSRKYDTTKLHDYVTKRLVTYHTPHHY